MDALPALAEMVEAGASAEGDDKNSVAAAAMLAVDLATEAGMKVELARMLVIDFAENGDIVLHAVHDESAKALRDVVAKMDAKGLESGTVAAADIEKAFEDASEEEEEEEEGERPSVPPPPPMAG